VSRSRTGYADPYHFVGGLAQMDFPAFEKTGGVGAAGRQANDGQAETYSFL